MSLVRRMRRALSTEERSVPWSTFGAWASLLQSGPTVAGSPVRAMQNAAVSAVIGLITDGVARTPWDAVRERGTARELVSPQPRLLADPNRSMVSARGWKSQAAFSLATHGNALGVVLASDSRGLPTEIQLVDPFTSQFEVRDGKKMFAVEGMWDTSWEMGGRYWHVPGKKLAAGSPYGLSPLAEARNTIGLGLAAEDFSNQFFSDGGHPTWGLASDDPLTEEQAAGLKEVFKRAFRAGSREPVVYGKGITPQQFSVQPGETQFLDTMRFVCEQVARFWGVPAAAIGAAMSGQSVTYSNVTDSDLRTLKDVFIGYFVAIEDGLSPCLPAPQKVKFNQDAVLRGDPKLRTEIISAQIAAGLLSVNEGRALLDLQPWGDEKYDEPFAGMTVPTAPAADPEGFDDSSD